jgi:hypothetical protein
LLTHSPLWQAESQTETDGGINMRRRHSGLGDLPDRPLTFDFGYEVPSDILFVPGSDLDGSERAHRAMTKAVWDMAMADDSQTKAKKIQAQLLLQASGEVDAVYESVLGEDEGSC